jgi:hypothetical protein
LLPLYPSTESTTGHQVFPIAFGKAHDWEGKKGNTAFPPLQIATVPLPHPHPPGDCGAPSPTSLLLLAERCYASHPTQPQPPPAQDLATPAERWGIAALMR